MIDFLHIQNFQSHKDTDLIFSPGVNVIVGTSDSGKSAIIRALRWVNWNRPSGDSFRSSWGGVTEVQVGIEEEKIIARRKDKIEEYVIGIPGHKDTIFKAFGTEVPSEITKQLQLSDINLQSQMDKPFLLSSSPGEVATHFNKVARLDKIDSALIYVNKWVRDLTSDIKYKEQDVKSAKVKLSTFDFLDKMEMDIEVVEEMQNRFTKKKSDFRTLSDALNNFVDIGMEIVQTEKILVIEKTLNEVLDLIQESRQKEITISELTQHLKDIAKVEKSIYMLTDLLKLEDKVNEVIKMTEDKLSKIMQMTALTEVLSNIEDVAFKLDENQTKLIHMEEEFHDNFPDQCPLCGTIIKKK